LAVWREGNHCGNWIEFNRSIGEDWAMTANMGVYLLFYYLRHWQDSLPSGQWPRYSHSVTIESARSGSHFLISFLIMAIMCLVMWWDRRHRRFLAILMSDWALASMAWLTGWYRPRSPV